MTDGVDFTDDSPLAQRLGAAYAGLSLAGVTSAGCFRRSLEVISEEEAEHGPLPRAVKLALFSEALTTAETQAGDKAVEIPRDFAQAYSAVLTPHLVDNINAFIESGACPYSKPNPDEKTALEKAIDRETESSTKLARKRRSQKGRPQEAITYRPRLVTVHESILDSADLKAIIADLDLLVKMAKIEPAYLDRWMDQFFSKNEINPKIFMAAQQRALVSRATSIMRNCATTIETFAVPVSSKHKEYTKLAGELEKKKLCRSSETLGLQQAHRYHRLVEQEKTVPGGKPEKTIESAGRWTVHAWTKISHDQASIMADFSKNAEAQDIMARLEKIADETEQQIVWGFDPRSHQNFGPKLVPKVA